MKILYLLIGGNIGVLSRYGLNMLVLRFFNRPLPLGTLLVNVLGCFVAGLVAGLGEMRLALTAGQRIMLITGFCGAFTTFSALIIESDHFVRSQSLWAACLNVCINVFLGFLFFRLGLMLGR